MTPIGVLARPFQLVLIWLCILVALGMNGKPGPGGGMGSAQLVNQGPARSDANHALPIMPNWFQVGEEPQTRSRKGMAKRLATAYVALPRRFEANLGQAGPGIAFVSRSRGYTLFLRPAEAVFLLGSRPSPHNVENEFPGRPGYEIGRRATVQRRAVAMKLLGANAAAVVKGLDEFPGRSNYFIGPDPDKWRTNIPSYAHVKYENVYPGIDLFYYGSSGELEYDFLVSPGADPRSILLSFEGVTELSLRASGDLRLRVGDEEIHLRKPTAYQDKDGSRTLIAARYVIERPSRVRFHVGPYEPSRPLVIDPVLVYATYLGGSPGSGGSGLDQGLAIAVDASGNAYITGTTDSTDFPTANPYQPSRGGGFFASSDVFVAKLNPAGTALLYSTYLGGSGAEFGTAITVDASGNAYVAGKTLSNDFPTTPGAFQRAFGGTFVQLGEGDAFVAKLNAAGNGLVYSTYLGGNGDDFANAIAVDSVGNAYVAGGEHSDNFPLRNPLPGPTGSGTQVAFVTKLNAAGSALVYSTPIAGFSGVSVVWSLAVDGGGNAYVTGANSSRQFPTTPGAFQRAAGGGDDAFVTKLNAAGNALLYSTYLGGNDDDVGYAIAVDSAGNAYVTGATSSTNFPTTRDLNASNLGFQDIFVTKLNAAGTGLLYSTYLGGNGGELPVGMAVDTTGAVYLTGNTSSTNFPVTPEAFPVPPSGSVFGHAFVLKLSPAGNGLMYSTFLGGSGNDQPRRIAVDRFGNAYVVGYTDSPDFRMTPGAIQTAFRGGRYDAFIARISEGPGIPPSGRPTFTAASVTNGASFVTGLTPGSIVTVFGTSLSNVTGIAQATSLPLPTQLIGTSVTINGISAPLFAIANVAGQEQINLQVPYEVTGQSTATLVANNNGVTSDPVQVSVLPAHPGIFTVDGTAGAILHANGQLVSSTNPAAQGAVVLVYATGLGPVSPAPGTGRPASSSPLSVTTFTPVVTVGGVTAEVLFSGLAPGFVGLYQVNVRILPNTPAGNLDVVIQTAGQASKPVKMAVQ